MRSLREGLFLIEPKIVSGFVWVYEEVPIHWVVTFRLRVKGKGGKKREEGRLKREEKEGK